MSLEQGLRISQPLGQFVLPQCREIPVSCWCCQGQSQHSEFVPWTFVLRKSDNARDGGASQP